MTVEIFIEKWSAPTGGVRYPWSIWKDGRKVHYGERHATPEEAEAEGRQYCETVLGAAPDRITRL